MTRALLSGKSVCVAGSPLPSSARRRYVKFVTTFISEMEPGSEKLKEAEALALKALDRIK
jgi:hypothetical protein